MMLGPSNTAGKIDSAFLFIVAACVILLAIVTICMVFFLIRYNRAGTPGRSMSGRASLLEVVWTVIPTILVIFMFYFGWVDFEFIRNPPGEPCLSRSPPANGRGSSPMTTASRTMS